MKNTTSRLPSRDGPKRHLAKTIIDAEKEGGCIICGEKDVEVLEFHHVDPELKDFTISANRYTSLDRLIEELRKCVLLCANDHKRVHAGTRELPKE